MGVKDRPTSGVYGEDRPESGPGALDGGTFRVQGLQGGQRKDAPAAVPTLMMAIEHWGLVPDITALAKGIASGFPGVDHAYPVRMLGWLAFARGRGGGPHD